MSTTLLINARYYETRVALVENGTCVEAYVERHRQNSVAGNIYLGRVARVLPGMQAAFVDIGLPKAAFLYAGDVASGPDLPDFVSVTEAGRTQRTAAGLRIENLLAEGQEVMIQVSKEPLGNKGARVTTHITLPGRNLVYMPSIDHVGVSRRIDNEAERERLRDLLNVMRPPGGGFIARTVSEGQNEEKLQAEMDFLISLWESLGQRRVRAQTPAVLHTDLSVSLRAVRDLFTRDVDRLVIDHPDEYQEVLEFVSTFMPRLRDSVELYAGKEPIFDAHGVEQDLTRALEPKVWLKSGGSVVIEKTEALTAIDVNTGRYVGGYNLEETILKTNLEAVKEIAAQLRLRDLGGLIVIDFIDMERESNRQRVVAAFEEALAKDRAKTNLLHMSALGLVEMTRKRVRESLGETIKASCFYCDGRGFIQDPTTVCYEVFRALERDFRQSPVLAVQVHLHPRVAEVMLHEEGWPLEGLENELGITVHVVPDAGLHAEQIIIVPQA